MPIPPVLILQHVWGDPPGLLEVVLQEQHLVYQIVQVGKDPFPDVLPAALILLGGPQSAYDDSLLPEKALVRHVLEQHIPCLGICLGGQVLAEVAGAQVHEKAATEIGFYELQLTREAVHDPLFVGFSSTVHQVFHWHHDTFDLPSGAVLLETGAGAYPQAFRYGKRSYGLQYHPELTEDLLDLWLEKHPEREKARAYLGAERYRQLEEEERRQRYPLYREQAVLLLTNFLRIADLL